MHKYLVEIEERPYVRSCSAPGKLDVLGLEAINGIIRTQKIVEAASPEEAADKILDLSEYTPQTTNLDAIYVVVKDYQGKELLRRSSND